MKLIKYLMVGSLSLISLFVVTSCNDNKDDTTTTGNIYYASPDGKENASGTKEDPLNGRYGLTATRNPGDTVIFAEGVYKIDVPINLMNVGTAANPLTIKAEEGAKVVIDFSDIELKVGTYHVIYSVKDSNENITETVLTVNYVTDEGPKLIINDVLIEVGENVNLEDFIEVIDESDLNAKDNLEIDTTDFNYKEAGIYYLTVLCHNSSGIYTNDFIKVEVVDNSSTKVASTLNIVLILLVVIVSIAVLIYYLIKKKRSKSAI